MEANVNRAANIESVSYSKCVCKLHSVTLSRREGKLLRNKNIDFVCIPVPYVDRIVLNTEISVF